MDHHLGGVVALAVLGVILAVVVIVGRNAIYVHGEGAVAGQSHIAVNVRLRGILGVLGIRSFGIGTDLIGLVEPGIGGTAEGIADILVQGELAEIALGKLHDAVAGNDVVLTGTLVIIPLPLTGDAHLGVAHHDIGAGAVADHIGRQGVEGIQAGLFTGHGLQAVEVVGQALVQADAQSGLGHLHGPVGAHIALTLGVVAQRTQQHLHECVAGQGTGGPESAVIIAGDDLLLGAVSNVAGKSVGDGNVLERGSVGRQRRRSGGAQQQIADDLGCRTAGQSGVGIEAAVGVTVDNPNGGDHVNSFRILDLAVVREVLGAGADGEQRQRHHQRQSQRKELLHGDVSSL